MRLNGCEAAVVGAGIGGLAAALALAQRGARVTVLERATALAELGAGIQVGPNGVAVLEALGLRDDAERLASVPAAILLREHRSGKVVARVPLGQDCVARYGRPYWQFHRADLLGLLSEAAAEAGVVLRLGIEVRAIEPGPAGVRIVTATEERAAAVAIAADGVRSTLRQTRFAGSAPRFTGHVAWRGLVPARALPAALRRDATSVWMGPGRHLVAYPLRGGELINFVAVEERASWTQEGWTHPDDPARLRAAFAGWAPEVTGLLAAVEETFLWGLFDHAELPEWVAGRLALLGDACHPMLPFLAQGATMALEDAWVLAAELDLAEDPAGGLMAYEARRKRRATRVQRAAARNGRIYHFAVPGARQFLHLGMRAVSAVAPGALIGRFDWLYGGDVVSADPRD
jgi:salicylate hydroxylase